MNGAESLMRTARAAGVEVCFANPGTTEMPLVAALDSVPGMRAILGLFEGVCTGAADGYGRMLGRPALTLLHLGPGFANGIANLHNARRAGSPIVNLIGDQTTWHRDADAPLTSDIESLARPVSAWVHSVESAGELAAAGARAIENAADNQIATLIVPADCQWEEASGPARPAPAPRASEPDAAQVEAIADALRNAQSPALLLGRRGLSKAGLAAAAKVGARAACRTLGETFPARQERGAGILNLERLPYFPEQAAESLQNVDVLVTAGARDPVAFFGYAGVPSRLAAKGCRVLDLAPSAIDLVAALERLADLLPATGEAAPRSDAKRPEVPSGELNPASLGAALAALQPDDAIVVDEGATSGLPYFLSAAGAPPHSYMALTGGAIGQGLPCATGAAIACPDRRVIALQADGSGMYTLQALWTQARENLNVTTVICANRSYRILQVELARAGIAEPGPQALSLTDLRRPELDWTHLARGLGVAAVRVENADDFARELKRSLAEPGPSLIEALL